ncbi:MAG: GxxExxY protein [Acidobacteria bacterium]|nr:GxxExxY protein [Acidobacteriota bacterium]
MFPNSITGQVVDAAIDVHRFLGPGLLESVYEAALSKELRIRGIDHVRQKDIHVAYKGEDLGLGFRADILVADTVVVEIKSVAEIAPIHQKQTLNYLKLARKPVGLLINFNVPLLKDGITRILNSEYRL